MSHIYGGNVIGSGSYGCVFLPALKCQNEKKRAPHKISKLMTNKYAKEEYYQIHSIHKKLSTIPQYHKYFLLKNITLCHPAPLSASDIKNFSQCNALPHDHIYASNINKNLDKIMAMNMPDGGVPLDEFLTTTAKRHKVETFLSNVYQINNYLIALLEKGIVPMNKHGVYHGDIKDTNVLVSIDASSLQVRLIDWGLAMEHDKRSPIPNQYLHCALQFNAPFSIILFSDDFKNKYEQFLIHKNTTMDSFLFNYLIWFVKKDEGHYKVINEIVYMLVASELTSIQEKDKSMVIETQYTLQIIIQYLAGILKKYTYRGTFQAYDYFNTVFIANLDIWGFICCYLPILQFLSENQIHSKVYDLVKELFLQILFQDGEKVISVSQLVRHLHKINSTNQSKGQQITHKYKYNKYKSTRRRRLQRHRKHPFINFQNPFLLSL